MSGHLWKIDDGRPHPLVIDLGTVAVFRDVALGLRQLLEKCGFDVLAEKLLRQIHDALTRLAPAENATAHANSPANGAGHA